MRKMRRESQNEIINLSINQTLGRTVITAGTALLSAIALFLFGGEVLHGFAFTMIVGIITGTYSSVFVAAAIVTFWRRTKPSKLSTAAPAAVATATTPARAAASRKSKSQRKAKAS
jgi:preprotein translocase subunit SecF